MTTKRPLFPIITVLALVFVNVFTFTSPAVAQQAPVVAQGGETSRSGSVLAPAPANWPRFDSAKPEETWIDWALDALCGTEDGKYDWATHRCVAVSPDSTDGVDEMTRKIVKGGGT
ncbi:MAG: hypothetical protein HYT39_02615 [Candidatus Sungbacteria bacterium]|nr:hypothetical protein [Candidatus Sungbacteria bacterium]